MCDRYCSCSCSGRCPDALPPPSIGKCVLCDEPITVGSEYATIDSDKYCRECLDGLHTIDWLELLGENIKEAELEKENY